MTAITDQLDAVLAHLDADRQGAQDRLFELLKMQSISTDSAYKDECRKAAEWLCADLAEIGFEASVRDTTGHPMVVGHSGDEGGPHLLFYGHYDVQPVDPLDLWSAPPFEPVIAEGAQGPEIRARGSSDDKGQLMTFVEACRAWKAVTGKLPARVTIFFEGEEESGSPSLIPFMQENAAELKADLAMICDTGMWDAETPAISTMLRGGVSEMVTIKAASRDLHSGMYGGPAMNPIRVLSKICASFHDDQGRVTLPQVYAALDCPGSFTLEKDPDTWVVLGSFTVQVDALPDVGETYVVSGWPLGRDGRKHFAGTAVHDAAGRCLARAHAVWVQIPAGSR